MDRVCAQDGIEAWSLTITLAFPDIEFIEQLLEVDCIRKIEGVSLIEAGIEGYEFVGFTVSKSRFGGAERTSRSKRTFW